MPGTVGAGGVLATIVLTYVEDTKIGIASWHYILKREDILLEVEITGMISMPILRVAFSYECISCDISCHYVHASVLMLYTFGRGPFLLLYLTALYVVDVVSMFGFIMLYSIVLHVSYRMTFNSPSMQRLLISSPPYCLRSCLTCPYIM